MVCCDEPERLEVARAFRSVLLSGWSWSGRWYFWLVLAVMDVGSSWLYGGRVGLLPPAAARPSPPAGVFSRAVSLHPPSSGVSAAQPSPPAVPTSVVGVFHTIEAFSSICACSQRLQWHGFQLHLRPKTSTAQPSSLSSPAPAQGQHGLHLRLRFRLQPALPPAAQPTPSPQPAAPPVTAAPPAAPPVGVFSGAAFVCMCTCAQSLEGRAFMFTCTRSQHRRQRNLHLSLSLHHLHKKTSPSQPTTATKTKH